MLQLKGKLYLIPVTLGGDDPSYVIPERVLNITKGLRHFAVEDLRSARRFLRLIDKNFPIDGSVFFELSEHTVDSDISDYLDPVIKGSDMGLMSEAGLPCIADPGSILVKMAHKKSIPVMPLSGPSSILLSLIASGFNGQNFTFNGYLPVKPGDLAVRIMEIEKNAARGYTQIFMETPYRNQKLLETLITLCHPETRLCIASDISLPGERIMTRTISEWKKSLPSLKDRLAVFLIG